jgi:regulatory protein
MEEDSLAEKATQKDFRLLAAHPRSEKELRTKLKEKGFEPIVIDRVIGKLYELNYLNDESFARGWARSLAVNRLYGNKRIEMSLGEKGIARSIAKQVVAEIREEFPETKAVHKLLQKKVRHQELASLDKRQKRSLIQNLMGKGFSPGLIFEVFKQFEEEFISDDGE